MQTEALMPIIRNSHAAPHKACPDLKLHITQKMMLAGFPTLGRAGICSVFPAALLKIHFSSGNTA